LVLEVAIDHVQSVVGAYAAEGLICKTIGWSSNVQEVPKQVSKYLDIDCIENGIHNCEHSMIIRLFLGTTHVSEEVNIVDNHKALTSMEKTSIDRMRINERQLLNINLGYSDITVYFTIMDQI